MRYINMRFTYLLTYFKHEEDDNNVSDESSCIVTRTSIQLTRFVVRQ